jgi:hypothetical protein
MTYNEWFRKRWYIFLLISGVAAVIVQYLIARYSISIGILIAYVVSYIIYRVEKSKV